MSKYENGDTVRIKNTGSRFDGLEGIVDGHLDTGENRYAFVNVPGFHPEFFYDHQLDLVKPYVEYEYAIQYTYGTTPRHIQSDRWNDKETIQYEFDRMPHDGADPVWGSYTCKMVKRLKAGRIEDV